LHYPDLPEKTEVVWLETADHISLRTARFPARSPERGQLVIVNGHREYMEKYAEFITEWQECGFSVYSMDHRGQGLSSRLLEDRRKSYIRTFDDYIADLHRMIDHFGLVKNMGEGKTVSSGGAQYILGHSMGGHIALRYLYDHPGVFDKAVLLSPMMGINLGPPFFSSLSRGLVRLAMRLGFDAVYAPGQGAKNREVLKLLVNTLLTHDARRYDEERRILERCPDLYSGGATFGWLDAALKSLETVWQPGYVESIQTPLLALLAQQEKLVDNKAARRLLSRLPNAEIHIVKGAYHEIYRETAPLRQVMWDHLRQFLDL
tara:strand:- start:10456 stop:11409 length:954 start_codon:yes stop_codon:yes gene_type:complete